MSSRSDLKNYFNTGDKPTENEFGELIDSFVHKEEDPYVESLPVASTTEKGVSERATLAEVEGGIDTERYVTPVGAKRAVEKFSPVSSVNGNTGDVVITIPTVTIPDTGWQTPTFQNIYANYSPSMQSARYRKVNNVVYLEGAISGGTAGQTIFTLPTGFKPSNTIAFSVAKQMIVITPPLGGRPTFSFPQITGRIDIDSTGNVIGTNIGTEMTSISGISFIVD